MTRSTEAALKFTVPMVPPFSYRWGNRTKVEVADTGCWNWVGTLHRLGYGISGWQGENYAHRAAYRFFFGEIPAGLTIDHTCRNRRCVNPAHLEAVPLFENIRRSPRTKLTKDQVAIIRNSSLSHAELGRRFGVTLQAVFRVRQGKSWKD